MKDDSLGSEYLPKHFWYHGMNKGKLGKGYRNGIPLGVISGPCQECDGTIISIKMNTSARGFETTSEKVCDKCGLVVPGAFQTLEPKGEYKGKYYATHEDWKEAMIPSIKLDDDIAWDNELFEHQHGKRPNTSDNIGYDTRGPEYKNINDKSKRIEKAIRRLSNTPASIKMDKQEWRVKQYHIIADDYINMLQLNNIISSDVHYYIDRNKMYMGRYSVEDVIYHLCLVYGPDYLLEYNEYNQKLYDLLYIRIW